MKTKENKPTMYMLTTDIVVSWINASEYGCW